MDFERILQTAVAAAYKAGNSLKSHFGRLKDIQKKGAIDIVTEADIESEKIIIETISGIFPDHAFLAEESGKTDGDSECRWIIDPLDGTTNFAHNLGIFAVSIGFEYKGGIAAAVVFNPHSEELFTAVKGKGAFLNAEPIKVSKRTEISESLLVTGFPYNIRERAEPYLSCFSKFLRAAQGVRRLGSAALDLCYVACGRFEGFWEQNLKPWDTAAGVLIVEEAGGRVSDFSGGHYNIDKKEILAACPGVHQQMIENFE